jgi:protein gp37
MADRSKIEWTDASWTPIRARRLSDGRVGWHCEHATTGCQFCYAESMNLRLGTGLPFKPGHGKDIELFLDKRMLHAPFRWKRPRMVFVCSMTDLFADFVPDRFIMQMWRVMYETPQHTYQILTKRPARMRAFIERWHDLDGEDFGAFKGVRGPDETRKAHPSGRGQLFAEYLDGLLELSGGQIPDGAAWPTFDWMRGMMYWPAVPSNVWLGVSAERQQEADQRIPDLLATPAHLRFVSLEPLLGPIDLTAVVSQRSGATLNALKPWHPVRIGGSKIEHGPPSTTLDWVIVGGESGREARPMHPDWARALRDQCVAAHVPFFFKQWGEWKPGHPGGLTNQVADGASYKILDPKTSVARVGKKAAGRLLDGAEWSEWPGAVSAASRGSGQGPPRASAVLSTTEPDAEQASRSSCQGAKQ